MTPQNTVLWTSDPLTIGKHEWRIVVAHYPHLEAIERATGQPDTGGRATRYEWRPLAYRGIPRDWCHEREWPTYDGDRSDGGTPRTLRTLWEREAVTIRALLRPHRTTPGIDTAAPQLSLFDTLGSTP